MTITEYKSLESLTLGRHKIPPNKWPNQGLVYIGLPEIIEFKDLNEKHCFVVY